MSCGHKVLLTVAVTGTVHMVPCMRGVLRQDGAVRTSAPLCLSIASPKLFHIFLSGSAQFPLAFKKHSKVKNQKEHSSLIILYFIMFRRREASATSHDRAQYVRLRNIGSSSSTAEAGKIPDAEEGSLLGRLKPARRPRRVHTKRVLFLLSLVLNFLGA
jgi:hypothetical protein